jgi:putative FmdB family regulatory protein
MPIYEFYCRDCGVSFDKLVRLSQSEGEIQCTECRGNNIKKKLSLISSRLKTSSGSATAGASCSPGGL